MHSYTDKIRGGDLILVTATGWTGKAISWFTKSKWCHVGRLVMLENRALIIEAMPPYVRIVPLSLYVYEKRQIMVRRIRKFECASLPLNDYDWMEINRAYIDHLMPQVGRRAYKESTLLRFPARMLTGIFGDDEDDSTDDGTVCSQQQSEADRGLWQLDPVKNKSDRFTSPADLAISTSYVTITENLQFNNEDTTHLIF